MSTRATVHFEQNGETQAIVYRHSDGYLEGLGHDLQTFFGDVQLQTRDTCFSDPCYLAAKFVVWQAARYARTNPLDFLGMGIVMKDPGDIEYRYHVGCNVVVGYDVVDRQMPKIVIEKV